MINFRKPRSIELRSAVGSAGLWIALLSGTATADDPPRALAVDGSIRAIHGDFQIDPPPPPPGSRIRRRPPAIAEEGRILPENGSIRLVAGQFLQEGTAPAPSAGTSEPAPSSISNSPNLSGGSNQPVLSTLSQQPAFASWRDAIGTSATPSDQAPQPQAPAMESLTSANQSGGPSTDIVRSLKESTTAQSVNGQFRSPVSVDPRVRGYRYGQVYNQIDGAYWLPGRQDLDTPLSMIAPSLIQSATVTPGPYAVQYGPGFAFIDVATAPTPRYECGHEQHYNVGATYYGNGDQLNGYARVLGGSADRGYSIYYNNRTGNDYRDGSGQLIPAEYSVQNFFGQYGYSIDEFQRIEFRYTRQEQLNTEIPGQFYNLDFAGTNGYDIRYTDESPDRPWTSSYVEGWYNETNYNGSTNPSDNYFNVVGRVSTALDNFLGTNNGTFSSTTTGNVLTTGARVATIYGDNDDTHLTTGADVRFVKQQIIEKYNFVAGAPPVSVPPFPGGNSMPSADSVDPGLFAIFSVPFSGYWTTDFGARVDWLNTTGVDPNAVTPSTTSEENILTTFFITNKIELAPNWDARIGMGTAQRAPTLIERYAGNIFIAQAQDGFTKMIGRADLPPERLYQLDASLLADYDNYRARLSGYYSWISNYSTFLVSGASTPEGARIFYSSSTPLATLAGIELYNEADLTSWLTGFGSLFYIRGRDESINQPLTQIAPLEGRAGLRFHDTDGGKTWGLEMYARMVDAQNDPGALRIFGGGGATTSSGVEEATPGFTVVNLRGYYNISPKFNVVAGINNVFDRNYLEHLSLRLPADGQYSAAAVFSPGFTPYVGVDWTY